MIGRLVGRARETSWLSEQLAPGDRGQVVVVRGEGGVGKTALVRSVVPAERLAAWVAYPSGRFATPGLGLRRLAEATGEAGAELRAQLAEGGTPGRAQVAAICAAADELVAQLGDGVVVLDDAQWSDELTQAWLSGLDERLRCAVVLVVRSVGDGSELTHVLAPLQRRGLVAALRLGALDVVEVGELATRLGLPCDAALAQRIHARTDGLALAVEEVVHGLLRQPEGSQHGAVVPPLSSVVGEQLLDLGDDARELVAAAAVLPLPASPPLLRRTARLAAARFEVALADATGSGLLVVAADGVAFRHDLQRDAVLAHLTSAERRAWHRRAARAMQARGGSAASLVAQQLLLAGADEDALPWLTHAADDAVAAHDYGNALALLSTALEHCPADRPDTRVALVDTAVMVARWAAQPATGLALLRDAMDHLTAPGHRARVHLGEARLVSFASDYTTRIEALQDARTGFAAARDDVGLATVLGQLAFPVGKPLDLRERARVGRDGLALARRTGDPLAIAICADSLALVQLYRGQDEAFALWAEAAAALDVPDAGPEVSETASRIDYNWAEAAVGHGRYADAHAVWERRQTLDAGPQWQPMVAATRALACWRAGDWDRALEFASAALTGTRYPNLDVAEVVRSAIAFERERSPVSAALERSAAELVEQEDYWAAVGHSVLVRIRAARREPTPHRGLARLVQTLAGERMRFGWEDALLVAAELGPAVHRAVAQPLDGLRPAGPRAEIVVAHADALGVSAGALLGCAAAYESLGEPYSAARAVEDAAAVHASEGRRAGELWHRAASAYADLGADRSLARLLRRAGHVRALDAFRIPASQAAAASVGLTERERDVVDLARLGLTAREIAAELGVTESAVRKHIDRAKGKLGVRRKSELVRVLADPR